ncbi:MAG TPA: hypothetical protein VNC82_07585 [Candidatus Limnocylindria bacterium]|nr:hypothetical protein [Candidatus Limnocylindria bacterium]
MRFDGEVALVSGPGIGRATALGFGERPRVAVADIDRGRAGRVAGPIVTAGGAAA